jgi:6-pyruvoyltetrahydropterin/6-carboxytetrahydropterin synthase
MLTVTKEFKFDCAHMLEGHEGLCKNVHGHTYKLFVEVQHFGPMTIEEGPSEGMVVDFKDLKNVVERRIVSKMDHAFIANENTAVNSNEAKIVSVLESLGMKIYKMHDRPTAENMSKHIYAAIEKEIKGTPIVLKSVVVYETPTSFAKFTL